VLSLQCQGLAVLDLGEYMSPPVLNLQVIDLFLAEVQLHALVVDLDLLARFVSS